MSLASIIVLLQAVLGLLTNPATANNPQVQSLANQAISMASVALAQPAETPLGVASTGTVAIQLPTSTDQPIVVNVQPVQPIVQQPVVTQPTEGNPVLSSAPAPLKRSNNNSNIVGNLTIDSGGSNTRFLANSNTVSIVLTCVPNPTKEIVNLNGVEYDLTVGTYGGVGGRLDIDAASAGLVKGETYPYSVYCENATQYDSETSTIVLQ